MSVKGGSLWRVPFSFLQGGSSPSVVVFFFCCFAVTEAFPLSYNPSFSLFSGVIFYCLNNIGVNNSNILWFRCNRKIDKTQTIQ